MTTQTTLFPKTELDEATAVLAHLITEEEKADKASDAADQKVADTASRVRKQRHVVARLQAMMPATEPIVEGDAVPDDVEDAEVLQIEGDVLDPITGEVTTNRFDDPPAGKIGTRCPDCDGDGRIPDKTGGGHHGKCSTCLGSGSIQPAPAPNVSVVVVLYPGSDEPVVTKIGDRTRYSELVADYLTEVGSNEAVDADEWAVVAEAELGNEAAEFGYRSLHEVIGRDDYGKRLLVVGADQGSVVGAKSKVGAA